MLFHQCAAAKEEGTVKYIVSSVFLQRQKQEKICTDDKR